MLGKTNLGGGGREPFALIHVTYPEGSICTCTKGLRTLIAPNRSGLYTFQIPEAGGWVVSCPYDTQIVNITAQYQTENVALNYKLYSAGTEYVSFENKRYTAQSLMGTYTDNSNYYTLGVVNGDTSICRSITNKIDLTSFSRLEATCQKRGQLTNFAHLSVYTADRPHAYLEVYTEIDSTKQAYSVDISNITGEYYICIGVATNASANQTQVDVYDISLK